MTGSKAVIDKNFYYEKTVPALIAAMNAQRKKLFVQILEGTKKPLGEYPFAQAVTDLHNYYLAGTYLGAIQAIQSDSGIKEKEQEDRLDKLKGVPKLKEQSPKYGETRALLTDTIGKLQQGDFDKVKKALDLLKINAPRDFEAAADALQKAVTEARDMDALDRVVKACTEAKIL